VNGLPEDSAASIPVVSLRAIVPGDEELLFRIFASTREGEWSVLNWSAAAKDAFLRQQCAAQHRHYQEAFAGGQFSVLVAAGEAIGRLYIWREAAEMRIIDLALLPAWRGRSIGSRLLRGLLEEAAANRQRVVIHVEANNPARRLYDRLGFRAVTNNGVYWRMEWTGKICGDF
jgi:ribosomal protein S18 acetylase RimI-like enzyme